MQNSCTNFIEQARKKSARESVPQSASARARIFRFGNEKQSTVGASTTHIGTELRSIAGAPTAHDNDTEH